MANSALQPYSPTFDFTSQVESQLIFVPPIAPPCCLNPPAKLPCPSLLIWASYSTPLAFVPNKNPFCWSLYVSIIKKKLSSSSRFESLAESYITIFFESESKQTTETKSFLSL